MAQPPNPSNPWFGIPSNISSTFTNVQQAIDYWNNQGGGTSAPAQPAGVDNTTQERNTVIQVWQQIYGRPPTPDQINAVMQRRNYVGAGNDFASAVDMNALQATIRGIGGQAQTTGGIAGGIADMAAPYLDYEKIKQQFLSSQEGRQFQKLLDETKARVQQKYDIDQQRLNYERQALEQDYNNYLSDLNEGRIQAGSDFDRERQANIQQRQLYLEDSAAKLKQNTEELNRSFIGRGGLFSGPREAAVGSLQSTADRATQAYEGQYGLSQGRLQSGYNEQIQQYAQQQRNAGLREQRGLQATGLQGQELDINRQEALAGATAQGRALQENLINQELYRQRPL